MAVDERRIYANATVYATPVARHDADHVTIRDDGVYVTIDGDATYTYPESVVEMVVVKLSDTDVPSDSGRPARVRWRSEAGTERIDRAQVLDDGWLRAITDGGSSRGLLVEDHAPGEWTRIEWLRSTNAGSNPET